MSSFYKDFEKQSNDISAKSLGQAIYKFFDPNPITESRVSDNVKKFQPPLPTRVLSNILPKSIYEHENNRKKDLGNTTYVNTIPTSAYNSIINEAKESKEKFNNFKTFVNENPDSPIIKEIEQTDPTFMAAIRDEVPILTKEDLKDPEKSEKKIQEFRDNKQENEMMLKTLGGAGVGGFAGNLFSDYVLEGEYKLPSIIGGVLAGGLIGNRL